MEGMGQMAAGMHMHCEQPNSVVTMVTIVFDIHVIRNYGSSSYIGINPGRE